MPPALRVSGLDEILRRPCPGRSGASVLHDVALAVSPGECLALVGPSGAGKSTLLRSLYGNYRADAGSIRVRQDEAWTELVGAEPRTVLDVRHRTMGFVSQFLRVIPRVAAVDVVAEPLLRSGAPMPAEARQRAEFLLGMLGIPARLWALPPATFSGGEQQRVNIARSLIVDYPILLLDEPTASLDAANRDGVVELICQRRDAGAAIVGIFHDTGVRDAVATRVHEVLPPASNRLEFAMRSETVLTNARVVTADAEFDGTGRRARRPHCRGRLQVAAHVAGAIDLEGDYLVPGLVELHTDNMEKHFAPRPGVKWPSVSAVMAHDTQISAAGITTVFDLLALGDVHGKSDRVQNRERMIEAVLRSPPIGSMTRAEHRIHLRCEITADDAVEAVDKWIDLPLVGLVSINDHTPGQRQFLDPEKLKQYYKGKYAMTDEQFEEFSIRVTELHHSNANKHRSEIVGRAQARALPIASHDDATDGARQEAVANGMTIAEFPTTHEAAKSSREAGLAILVRCAQPRAGRLAFRQHRGHRPAARRPCRNPVVRLCAGEPDGEHLQAARLRHRHLAAAGREAGLPQSGTRRRPRRPRRDRRRAPRRSGARPRRRRCRRRARRLARRRTRRLRVDDDMEGTLDLRHGSFGRRQGLRCSAAPCTLLPADAPVVFAHRYITRPADSGGENHVAVTPGRVRHASVPTASSPITGTRMATTMASVARSTTGGAPAWRWW